MEKTDFSILIQSLKSTIYFNLDIFEQYDSKRNLEHL